MENLPKVGIYAGLAGLALLILLFHIVGCACHYRAYLGVAHSPDPVTSTPFGRVRSFSSFQWLDPLRGLSYFFHLFFALCFDIRTAGLAFFAIGFGVMRIVGGLLRPWRICM